MSTLTTLYKLAFLKAAVQPKPFMNSRLSRPMEPKIPGGLAGLRGSSFKPPKSPTQLTSM
jgi:hypothetical protein